MARSETSPRLSAENLKKKTSLAPPYRKSTQVFGSRCDKGVEDGELLRRLSRAPDCVRLVASAPATGATSSPLRKIIIGCVVAAADAPARSSAPMAVSYSPGRASRRRSKKARDFGASAILFDFGARGDDFRRRARRRNRTPERRGLSGRGGR